MYKSVGRPDLTSEKHAFIRNYNTYMPTHTPTYTHALTTTHKQNPNGFCMYFVVFLDFQFIPYS